MFKIICKEDNCEIKNVPYYMVEPAETIICGGCKTQLSAKEMTEAEYKKVFDYNPFKQTPMNNDI